MKFPTYRCLNVSGMSLTTKAKRKIFFGGLLAMVVLWISLPQFLVIAAPGAQSSLTSGWDKRFGLPVAGGYYGMNTVATIGNDVYIGGDFSTVAQYYAVNNIARWDGIRWHALGQGLNGEVNTITVVGNDLYVGGAFTKAGNRLAKGIARWDGSAWHPVGSGVGTVSVSAIAEYNGNLYIAGSFTSVDGVPANSIAMWNGSAWSAVSGGIMSYNSASTITDLLVHQGELYVAGSFAKAGNVATNNLARWDGSQWATVGNDDFDVASYDSINTLASMNDELYVGGDFNQVNGQVFNNLARWNGTTWASVGNGVQGDSYGVAVKHLLVVNNQLYSFGKFDLAGAVPANNVAKWDGSNWSALGNGVLLASSFDDGITSAAVVSDGSMYVGGSFSSAGERLLKNMARWDGQQWFSLGLGVSSWYTNFDGTVHALATNEQGQVFVGGRFEYVAGIPTKNFAMWDGERWHTLGDVDGTVFALVMAGDNLYIGGDFTRAGGIAASHVARYNLTSKQWFALDSGVNSTVYTLLLHQGKLYAGGEFSAAGLTNAHGVAWWDGTNWHKFGAQSVTFATCNFHTSPVYTLAASDNYILIGGCFFNLNFNGVPGQGVDSFVAWDETSDEWFPLGAGFTYRYGHSDLPARVYDILLTNNYLYVAGEFDKADTISANAIARFNFATLRWEPAHSGMGSNDSYQAVVRSLLTVGGDLYATGRFDSAGGIDAAGIAKWSEATNTWSALEAGLIRENRDDAGGLALLQTGNSLYVGGRFIAAGDYPSAGFARWILPATPAPTSTPFPQPTTTSQPGQTPTPTPTPTATPMPTATPTPAPRLTAQSNATGAPGSHFVFTGSGFPPNQQLSVSLLKVGVATAAQPLADTVQSDGNGNVTFTLATADTLATGDYLLIVGGVNTPLTIDAAAGVQQPTPQGVILTLTVVELTQRSFLPLVAR